ncbi:MAG: hypothetical protein CMQ13_01995 [Gammaproteobacteria bacterium]|nr:hypothetical protein [Gammaproteobacteria bacterium]
MPDPTKTNSVNEVETQATEANDEAQQTLTLGQMFGSAIAAMIGVQSKEKRERDFARGKASHFIIVGVMLTAAFVLVMAGVVTLVLRVAL